MKNHISILTRVEGHASVELVLNGKRVVDGQFKLHESPRMFESILIGKSFDEIADIACRICSICSTVHKVAALQAVENAFNITISRQTTLLRALAISGGEIESHALHIFCLLLPDYLGVKDFQEAAKIAPEKLQLGLRIKKLGNMIQETVGGRAIHPFNLILGGIGKPPEAYTLKKLLQQLDEIQNDLEIMSQYFFSFDDILPQLSQIPFCAAQSNSSAYKDRIVTTTGIIISADDAPKWLNRLILHGEQPVVNSFDTYTPFIVGPLARIMLKMPAGYSDYFTDTSIRSSTKARVIEIKQSVKLAQTLIETLLENGLQKETPVKISPKLAEGSSLIEAPRGTLLHNYRFDRFGICSFANIITPTAINQSPIALSLKSLIRVMDGADYDQIKSAAEILIRCYDPCISCAVH